MDSGQTTSLSTKLYYMTTAICSLFILRLFPTSAVEISDWNLIILPGFSIDKTFSIFLTARRGQTWPVRIATEFLKQHNTVSNYSWLNLPSLVCLAVFWPIQHYVPGCNASLYKGHFSYEVDHVLDIVMSWETTAIPPYGVWVARKSTLELSFLSYQEFYLYLQRT